MNYDNRVASSYVHLRKGLNHITLLLEIMKMEQITYPFQKLISGSHRGEGDKTIAERKIFNATTLIEIKKKGAC